MASTNTYPARLSCKHVIDVPVTAPIGDHVACTKCPPLKSTGQPPARTIKDATGTVTLREVPAANTGPSDADVAEALGKLKAELESPEMAKAIAADLPVGVHADRNARLEAAKLEAKALGAWKASGASNGRPVTPNLDALEAERAAIPRTTTGAKAVATKAPTPAGTGKARQADGIRFYRNGKPMPDSQNKLSSVAYQATKGMGSDGGRLSTAALTDLLHQAGIAHPESSAWEHTLANGVIIAATMPGTGKGRKQGRPN
jgi:hypothetical protein